VTVFRACTCTGPSFSVFGGQFRIRQRRLEFEQQSVVHAVAVAQGSDGVGDNEGHDCHHENKVARTAKDDLDQLIAY